jgi:pyrimidine operon attenuation protein/uracil phosphoribosyltransferase
MDNNKILDKVNINNATRRIAYQIYESNIELEEIYLVGISSNGVILSNRIGEVLKKISHLNIHQIKLRIDKKKSKK